MIFEWIGRHFWLVTPLLMAFTSVWWLIPQRSPAPRAFGYALGVAVLLLIAVHRPLTGNLVREFLFTVFAFGAVFSAICMVGQPSPVHAALLFASTTLHLCGLYLLLSAPFLAAGTVIVYAGAIIVTFLFVVMLAQQSGQAIYDARSRDPVHGSVAGFLLLGCVVLAISETFITPVDRARLLFEPMLQRVMAVPDPLPAGTRVAPLQRSLFNVNDDLTVHDAVKQRLPLLPAAARERMEGPIAEVERELATAVERPSLETLAVTRTAHKVMLSAMLSELKAVEVKPLLRVDADLMGARSSVPADGLGTVAGLGRTLFEEYLLGVELAGTLLLIATIGAVAMAPRRARGTL